MAAGDASGRVQKDKGGLKKKQVLEGSMDKERTLQILEETGVVAVIR